MKLLRVKLTDYRGIVDREVTFGETGVTVLEGANETGKSSVIEAVGLLFDYKDSSKAAPVKAVAPIGRDVGSRIEVEARVGGVHFTGVKQFHRQTMTELVIHAPSPAQLAGDEAHDRLQAILSEGLDRALLDALWFRQGTPLEQPTLGGSSTLTERLDATAGAEPGDDALFDRVAAEFATYWTPKSGKPRQHLVDAQTAIDRALEVERGLADRLGNLESDIATAERLTQRIAEAERAVELQRRDHEARQRELEQVTALRSEVARLEATAQVACARAEQAGEADARRRERVAWVDKLDGDLKALRDDADALARAQALQRETEELERRRLAARHATDHAADARRRAAAARADAELLARQEELAALRDRRRRIEEAQAAAEDAAAFLAVCLLDDSGLDRIREAHMAAEHARRQLEADAPRLEVEALAEVEVSFDGDDELLAAGQRRERPVPDATAVNIANLAEVRLRAGTSLDDLAAQLAEAEADLAAACDQAGVADLDHAHTVLHDRRVAEEALTERDREVAIALDGRTSEQLDEAIAAGDAEVTGQLQQRDGERDLPPDLGAARALADAAADEESAAEERAHVAREAVDALAGAVEELRDAQRTHEARVASVEEQLNQERRRLDAERDGATDAALEQAAADTAETQTRASSELAAARRRLDALDPERVELLADNAAKTLDSTQRSLADDRSEHSRVTERLRLLGNEGLGEQLEHARAERMRAEDAWTRLRSRADAAKLLYEVMSAQRDRVRAAYRAPLAAEIARAGRLVYDGDFAVELDESLAVATRTLDGTTVPWDSLSSGAREQLSLLMALAAARLVADEGVPLVLDDLLGYTDPGRLQRVGAVLSRAGAEHQIVVLTCVADRYRHVGDATVVHLE